MHCQSEWVKMHVDLRTWTQINPHNPFINLHYNTIKQKIKTLRMHNFFSELEESKKPAKRQQRMVYSEQPGKVLPLKWFVAIKVILWGGCHKPRGTSPLPSHSPPSSITQMLPQMSSCCCHVKLRSIGCNQGMRRACPSKSRSPQLPRPLPHQVYSAFMSSMFHSPFLSAHIGPVIFTPTDWLLVTQFSQSPLTAPCLPWLYDIIICLYHHHQYSWPQWDGLTPSTEWA